MGASEADVLVFGADPDALALACVLRRLGVARVRVFRPVPDWLPGPVPALVDAPTAAGLAAAGLEGVLAEAGAAPLARVFAARAPRRPGRSRGTAGGGAETAGEVAFAPGFGPGPFAVDAAALRAALEARLTGLGTAVGHAVSLGAVLQSSDGVSAALLHHIGDEREVVRARWLVCTTRMSHLARDAAKIAVAPDSTSWRDGLEGGGLAGLVRLPAPQPAGMAHLWADGRGAAAVLPVRAGLAHVQLLLPGGDPSRIEVRARPTLSAALGLAAGAPWTGCMPALDQFLRCRPDPPPRLRDGRILLSGEAAHGSAWDGIEPVSASAKLADALALAPRLAAVSAGSAPEAALDAWAAERRAAALRVRRLTGAERVRALAEGRLEDAGALVLGHRAVPARSTDGAGPRWHLVPPDAGAGGAP